MQLENHSVFLYRNFFSWYLFFKVFGDAFLGMFLFLDKNLRFFPEIVCYCSCCHADGHSLQSFLNSIIFRAGDYLGTFLFLVEFNVLGFLGNFLVFFNDILHIYSYYNCNSHKNEKRLLCISMSCKTQSFFITFWAEFCCC